MYKIKHFIILLVFTTFVYAQSKVITPLDCKKGELLFSDDFERENIDDKWQIKEKFTNAFYIDKGTLVAKELKNAGHGSVARALFSFSDVIIEFDLMFNGANRLNIVMDDSLCKSVWAGHISRISFNKKGFKVQDDKTGTMNLEIRDKIKDNPKKKLELKEFLNSKLSEAKMVFEEGKFYHVVITKKEDILECKIGDVIAQIKSEGIMHPTLNKFGPTVIGDTIAFDNFKIWEIKE
ncbi:hypothetical protein CLV91_2265 [Maribacter vaceletii]|uniref:3-keto-disaccharide hydrolase domain-containing protein n=1 Tax=Maribacter vaceletii TaxID=1206816 RepID=A0A495E5E8_9FLAO|nr:hypothetical protein [Maribacter vaceletii]RKR12142.1 hypothetical protein CLV91_2265 [Maribacter vaceletii]